MDSRKLYDRFFTIFGTMMIFFYFFLAYFVMFSPSLDHIDKPLRIMMGIPMIAYGLYRITVSYRKIKENFFDDGKDD